MRTFYKSLQPEHWENRIEQMKGLAKNNGAFKEDILVNRENVAGGVLPTSS